MLSFNDHWRRRRESSVLDVLAKKEEELKLLMCDYASLESALCELRARITDVRHDIQRQRNQLAAIHALPIEILVLVFSLATEHPRPKLVDSSLHLSHVCTSWRALAFGTPSLWARLRMVVRPNDDVLAQHEYRDWFARAQPYLVDVDLTDPRTNAGVALAFLTASGLAAHIGSFALQVHCYQLRGWASTSFPALKHLSIRLGGHVRSEDPVVLFSGSDHLFSLELSGYAVMDKRAPHQMLDFRWQQLIRLNLTAETSPAVRYTLLSQCTQLRFLDIRVTRWHYDIESPVDVVKPVHSVVLAHLTELRVSLEDNGQMSFLAPFSLPVLQICEICYESDAVESDCALHLVEFAKRCFAHLTCFRLVSEGDDDDASRMAALLLPYVHHVDSLSLSAHRPLHSCDLERVSDDSPKYPLPSLRELRVEERCCIPNSNASSCDTFVAFVLSRWQTRNTAQLRVASYWTDGKAELSECHAAQLAACRAEGLKIELRSSDVSLL
ncbi:hypothetical protein FISHEDRAFT_75275 [Fistulina hepatica ATCC 64428]|uniref:F-box domain-containing protein n=1 Tax=Fistulina hepatica ATCC 64428 TaxID=1128425 RepID=A0A0D7A775_9AGAR|nr:hypothetical protein FISHEDRAFT_75275 [Fistulina hepatica ATCC 64428]